MKTILLVDDSATSRLLFKAYLPPDHGHRLVEAADAHAALDLSAAEHPDLVVLDYNMPDLSGIELARKLREAGIDAGLVLLTANMQQAIVQAAQDMGFADVVEKPINADKVDRILEALA